MHRTECGAWFVFAAITLAQGTDPNPVSLLAMSGNF
jgi:hypothetical protein